MILLFAAAFGAAWIMFFIGTIRAVAVNSHMYDYESNTMYKARKRRLHRHWRITLALFAIAVYAAMHL